MGWTGTHATHYKNGKVDRKAECDSLFSVAYRVVKSTMVGSVYYAAIEHIKEYKGRDADDKPIYEDVPENEREVFAAIILTRTDLKDYFNFNYKDMDETCGPCEITCPASILDLLSSTDNEWALQWRQRCRENIAKRKAARKNPKSLNNLPEGSIISFVSQFNMTDGTKKGDKITLQKGTYRGKTVWRYGLYRFRKTWIPDDYEVLEA